MRGVGEYGREVGEVRKSHCFPYSGVVLESVG